MVCFFNVFLQEACSISVLPVHAICPAYLVFLNLISHIICGQQYKSWSPSLCSFFQSPVTSSLLGPNISPAACFLTPSAHVFFLIWGTKFHTNLKQQTKLYFCTLGGSKFTWHSTFSMLLLVSSDFYATLYFNFQIAACFNAYVKQFNTMSSRPRES